MDNPIHVEIQIVELFIVGVRTSCIDGNNLSINLARMLLNNRG